MTIKLSKMADEERERKDEEVEMLPKKDPCLNGVAEVDKEDEATKRSDQRFRWAISVFVSITFACLVSKVLHFGFNGNFHDFIDSLKCRDGP